MSGAGRSVAVVGNSVAAMMSALALGEAGWNVSLVTPTGRLGGHFAGLTLGSRTFDAGMVFLEFTSFNTQSNAELSTYDPTRRNDVGRFFPLVEQTLGRFGAWRSVETPQMRIGGRVVPDLIIANRLSSLRALPVEPREQMRRELTALVGDTRGPLHPSRKTTDPAFAAYDLETISLANHGRTLHQLLIEPFCRKLTADAPSSLLAMYHRMVWLPLFYPESLVSALNDEPMMFPDTVFSYPTNGSVASLVHELGRELRAQPLTRIIEDKVNVLRRSDRGDFTLGATSGETITVDRLVWASDQEALLRLCGENPEQAFDRASLTLVSALVRSSEIDTPLSTLLVPADERLPFRVTNQSVASGESAALSRISCEWNSTFLDGDQETPAERAREALVELHIVRSRESVVELRVDSVKGALTLPTAANVALSTERQRILDSLLPTVPRVGPAAPYGATSFNDQIIQGLKVGRELGAPT